MVIQGLGVGSPAGQEEDVPASSLVTLLLLQHIYMSDILISL